jgi:hypothetical protein
VLGSYKGGSDGLGSSTHGRLDKWLHILVAKTEGIRAYEDLGIHEKKNTKMVLAETI